MAGNLYPVTSAAYISDGSTQLSVVVDRSEGASSLASGSLELLVQRRMTQDDGQCE